MGMSQTCNSFVMFSFLLTLRYRSMQNTASPILDQFPHFSSQDKGYTHHRVQKKVNKERTVHGNSYIVKATANGRARAIC